MGTLDDRNKKKKDEPYNKPLPNAPQKNVPPQRRPCHTGSPPLGTSRNGCGTHFLRSGLLVFAHLSWSMSSEHRVPSAAVCAMTRGFNHCFHRIVRRNNESPPATAWLRQRVDARHAPSTRAAALSTKLRPPNGIPYTSGEHRREHTTTSLTLRNSYFLR